MVCIFTFLLFSLIVCMSHSEELGNPIPDGYYFAIKGTSYLILEMILENELSRVRP